MGATPAGARVVHEEERNLAVKTRVVQHLGVMAAMGLLLASAAGCSWRMRSFGETWYICGSYNANDPHRRREVEEAAKKAMHAMEMPITTVERSPDRLMLESEGERKVVRVHLIDREDFSTRVKIRVNSFGNRRLSRKLLEAIQANLKTPAPGK